MGGEEGRREGGVGPGRERRGGGRVREESNPGR